MGKLAILIMPALFALQAATAQELVNLMEPYGGEWFPGYSDPELFDRDTSTFTEIFYDVFESLDELFGIRPTRYRIVMPAHVAVSAYPSSWQVIARRRLSFGRRGARKVLDKVSAARFKNRIYEGSLAAIDWNVKYPMWFQIKFDLRNVDIAEIEFLGPREALDALWPYGKYPCAQRLTPIPGMKSAIHFSFFNGERKNPPYQRAKWRRILAAQFDMDGIYADNYETIRFETTGRKDTFIGIIFPSATTVNEVAFGEMFANPRPYRKVILQGSQCQPSCRKYDSKGWVRLGVQTPLPRHYEDLSYPKPFTNKLYVEKPANYQAYRLKILGPPKAEFFFHFIYLLQCAQ